MSVETPDHYDGPRELNPFENLRLRFMFASNAAVVCILAGFIYGGIVVLLGRWAMILAIPLGLLVGIYLAGHKQ